MFALAAAGFVNARTLSKCGIGSVRIVCLSSGRDGAVNCKRMDEILPASRTPRYGTRREDGMLFYGRDTLPTLCHKPSQGQRGTPDAAHS